VNIGHPPSSDELADLVAAAEQLRSTHAPPRIGSVSRAIAAF
jgi:hypothetical protein